MKKYFPILKSKKGEMDALSRLSTASKFKTVPIMEILYNTDKFINNLNSLSSTFTNTVLNLNSILIDKSRLTFSYSHLLSMGDLTRTIFYTQTSNDYYIVIRPSDFPLIQNISTLLNNYFANVTYDNIIILIDLGVIDNNTFYAYQATLGQTIQIIYNQISNVQNSFIALGSSSFPKDLSSCKVNRVTNIRRLELELFIFIINQHPKLLYSDYTISSPIVVTVDPKIMTISASIRYTDDMDYKVHRGASIKKYGSQQYYQLALDVVSSSYYSGRMFSAGDEFIDNCAQKILGPGNATTWRFVGVNHHIEKTLNQLSTMGVI